MPERRAHFRFVMDEKIAVENKRALATLTSTQIYNAMTFSNRALTRLNESVVWLERLHHLENLLLAQDLYEDPTEAREEQQLRAQALDALKAAKVAVAALRQRKIEAAMAMEEEFDPLLKTYHAPKPKPKKKTKQDPEVLGPEEEPQVPDDALVLNGARVRQATAAEVAEGGDVHGSRVVRKSRAGLPAPPTKAETAAPAPPPKPALKIDPKLLLKARREMQAKKENAANELSGTEVGNR